MFKRAFVCGTENVSVVLLTQVNLSCLEHLSNRHLLWYRYHGVFFIYRRKYKTKPFVPGSATREIYERKITKAWRPLSRSARLLPIPITGNRIIQSLHLFCVNRYLLFQSILNLQHTKNIPTFASLSRVPRVHFYSSNHFKENFCEDKSPSHQIFHTLLYNIAYIVYCRVASGVSSCVKCQIVYSNVCIGVYAARPKIAFFHLP